jgi:hypothetical protein
MIGRRAWTTFAAAASLLIVLGARALYPSSGIRLRTEDRNGDGRPDVWKYYDDRGTLLHVAIDTNFDGRSDIDESFEQGQLVARQQDRNFDDRVDRIDTFDVSTGQLAVSTIDVDLDGRADEEVFFRDGRPVAVHWAEKSKASQLLEAGAERRRAADDPLEPFDNPFGAESRVRTAIPRTEKLSAEAARPALPITFFAESVLAAAPVTWTAFDSFVASPDLALCRPRGPPIRHLRISHS